MAGFTRILAAAGLAVAAFAATAETTLQDVRVWAAPERTRVVFDLSEAAEHSVFTLDGPPRVVIDLNDTDRRDALVGDLDGKGAVRRIRTGVHEGGDLRVVLDLAESVPPKSFALAPNGEYGHRLVVDLEGAGDADAEPAPPTTERQFRERELVVAVDAGHGGEDPGAIGPSGTREKDVVLQIARRLEAMINERPGMRAVMIRDGDYYVGLRERIQKARAAKADLFVSLHADAFPDRRARGASVYALSRNGASSEHARWLAERENAADLIGGVSLKDKDDQLASFMLDLSQGASIEASLDVGGRILERLDGIAKLHKEQVQQAGFLVLKSPDIPSILVETAFISNPHEERRLRDAGYQRQLAEAVLGGVDGYLASYRPGSRFAAAGSHEVRSGETLSGIAMRYGVDTARLRRANGLSGDTIRVGQVLEIPAANAQLAASSP
ncbi:N-acetylmuramoyl-L-alanine amidase domain-containing protein [Salinisphaera sp. PC39]|uniref:N-acetylmuramoyl-L-alanine amidase n=1 Tax=Salinisphaera sp. PC39 TaxID=1304156 RepID=UPI00333F43BB